MSKYKRLTDGGVRYKFCSENCGSDGCANCYFDRVWERLAELEDKIETGTLVEYKQHCNLERDIQVLRLKLKKACHDRDRYSNKISQLTAELEQANRNFREALWVAQLNKEAYQLVAAELSKLKGE